MTPECVWEVGSRPWGGTSQPYFAQFDFDQPEIDVQGNGLSIVNGDVTPDVADDTDFGSVAVGSTVEHVFLILNQGTKDLTISGANVSNGAAFSITQSPDSPVLPKQNTTMRIACSPTTAGTFNATVTIANDDANENPYTFVIQGQGRAGGGEEGNVKAPSNLTATSSGAAFILLTWLDNSNNETGFEIQRKEGSGDFLFRALLRPNVTQYYDGINAGSYSYRIRSVNASGYSAFSNEASTQSSGHDPDNKCGATGVEFLLLVMALTLAKWFTRKPS